MDKKTRVERTLPKLIMLFLKRKRDGATMQEIMTYINKQIQTTVKCVQEVVKRGLALGFLGKKEGKYYNMLVKKRVKRLSGRGKKRTYKVTKRGRNRVKKKRSDKELSVKFTSNQRLASHERVQQASRTRRASHTQPPATPAPADAQYSTVILYSKN